MKETIQKILDVAVSAPSGDNCQPWSFKWADEALHIYNLPDKDTSLYNYKQRASYIAHGALLENIIILASSFGLSCQIEYFPDQYRPEFIASIQFSASKTEADPLQAQIEKRCTNRKKYSSLPLSSQQAELLCASLDVIQEAKLSIKTNRDELKSLAKILSNNDRMVFENKHLHQFLFDHIRWTENEAKQTLDGMDIKTLELKQIDQIAFKFFRNWSFVEKLNKLGLSKIVALNGEKLIKASAAIAALTITDLNDKNFVAAGRVMQRFWLAASHLGLSVQPIAGLPLLIQRVNSEQNPTLNLKHQETIKDVESKLKKIFELEDQKLVMLFRLGTSAQPSERSLRQKPILA